MTRVYCVNCIKVIKADMVTESACVVRLYLFRVTSNQLPKRKHTTNQLLLEPEVARLLTPRSTVLSGLDLVDTFLKSHLVSHNQ